MRELRIRRAVLDGIEQAAREDYPEEACGFLLSAAVEPDGPVRTIVAAEPAPNEVDQERGRRFVISAEGLRSAELLAASRDEAVTGFYHSHPDHPAAPSAFDTEHAWPWYTYVVVAVDRRGTCQVGAFELAREGGRFAACPLTVEPGPPEERPVPTPLPEDR